MVLTACQNKSATIKLPLLRCTEIPYQKGESKQIFEVKPSKYFDKSQWFTNDHCLVIPRKYFPI